VCSVLTLRIVDAGIVLASLAAACSAVGAPSAAKLAGDAAGFSAGLDAGLASIRLVESNPALAAKSAAMVPLNCSVKGLPAALSLAITSACVILSTASPFRACRFKPTKC